MESPVELEHEHESAICNAPSTRGFSRPASGHVVRGGKLSEGQEGTATVVMWQ